MRLAQVCEELGFNEEAAIYRKLISDSDKADIKVKKPKAKPEGLVPLGKSRAGRRATSNDGAAASSTIGDRLVGVKVHSAKSKIKKPVIWR